MQPKYRLHTVKSLCRNNGVGDYFRFGCGYIDGWWDIEATETDNPIYSKLILIHELIECVLVEAAGIPEPAINAFDSEFEARIQRGEIMENAEPGDALDAPYRAQHLVADQVEKLLCDHLGISFEDYSSAIDDLIKRHKNNGN